jgi:hypothetical protein
MALSRYARHYIVTGRGDTHSALSSMVTVGVIILSVSVLKRVSSVPLVQL